MSYYKFIYIIQCHTLTSITHGSNESFVKMCCFNLMTRNKAIRKEIYQWRPKKLMNQLGQK